MARKNEIKRNLGVGRQLANRVSSGAITQQQANRTAAQRRLFANAFGSDWRTEVYGQGGARGLNGPFSVAEIRTKRNAALDRALRKVGRTGAGGIGPSE